MFLAKLKYRLKKHPTLFNILKKINEKTWSAALLKIRNIKFRRNGIKALTQFDKAAQEAGLNYWLVFGTLLGAIRENAFISHDCDIDVGAYLDDHKLEHEHIFKKYGFKKTRQFLIENGSYGREETYEFMGVSIDIFYFSKAKDNIYCHTFTQINEDGTQMIGNLFNEWRPREISHPLSEFRTRKLYDRTFNIPENFHDVLVCDYGENYMIPDPNYASTSRENVKYLRDKTGTLHLKSH
jgi:hypothetical protein